MKTKNFKFEELVGKVFTSIVVDKKDSITFKTDSEQFIMEHYQDCCETVEIESIVGELEDLIGNPILVAEVSTSDKEPEGFSAEYRDSSETWTFYKLATIKGHVDIRWYGSSNGYYSEEVDFNQIIEEEK